MDRRKNEIVAALQGVFAPRAIVERSDVASRKFEGLPNSEGLVAGAVAEEIIVKMNGLAFASNLLAGQKTGLYLDQQVNYQRVAALAPPIGDGQVLDCFSFHGGFALHVARAGAAHVHALDQSTEATGTASRNAALNGLAEKCSFDAANVFDWLRAQTATSRHEKLLPKFDLIILDPPSFTRNRAAVPNGLLGYRNINVRPLKLLKPGGTL